MRNFSISILLAFTCVHAIAQSGSGNNADISSTVCGVYAIGDAPNYSAGAGGSQAVVSYDKDLNTVVLVHRAECSLPPGVTNTGYYTYDISTDGGTNWSVNQGPIYGVQMNPGNGCGGGTVLGPHRGRYPKGVVYNPTGNTDPNNAHIVYTGPWNTDDQSAATNWYGQVHGTGHINGSPANENYDSLLSGMAIWPEDIFVTKTGVSWILGTVGAQDAAHTYRDSIAILKGTWNGSDFVYSYYPFHYVINPDAMTIPDMNIAFSDDGLTGYIAMLTNQDPSYTIYPDSSYYIQVFKTEDGGTTWSCPTDIVLAGAMDSALVILNNMHRYGTAWDLDIVIDKNNNLHIITTVVPNNGGYYLLQNYPYGTIGIFDFYTSDGGNTYHAQLLAHPETFRGSIGTPGVDEISEYLRPFASRTWDGSKLFFGWFDTDTLYWGIYENDQPDLHLVGYDVDANFWTSDLSNLLAVNAGENITTGTAASGKCWMGNGSYYSIDSAGNYKVPVVYLDQPNPDFRYIDCASPSGTFTHPGHPLNIPVNHASPLCADGSGVVLSTSDIEEGILVSSNYPNPFSGKTSVDVTLVKAEDVTIEIRNVVGQILVTSNYKNLHAGLNTLTIDATSLAHGLYFFTVKAGNKSVTRTMAVE